ncbi:hypothetical protein C0584_05930 [Candidatus Parcubacteria bacterium]|nr:MAG: hypothetical protein C0584_05930 [Candidatus Parcubacteria bacterium]
MRRKRVTITIRDDVLKKVDTIIDGKTIRNRSNAIETVLLEKFKNNVLQKAVILGASRAIKIGGKSISEVLLPVNGKPLIERHLEKLSSVGVNEVIIATGKYFKEVKNVIGDGTEHGMMIDYIDSKGTANILNKAKTHLKSTFLVFNGDIYINNIDLEDIYNFHKSNTAMVTMAVATNEDPTKLGSVTMKGLRVSEFREKQKDTSHQSHLVSAGLYLMEPEICKMDLAPGSMLEHDVFPQLAKRGNINGYQSEEIWIHLHDEQHLKTYRAKGLV